MNQGKHLARRDDDEVDFVVSRENLPADMAAPGIAYRNSMDLDDRDASNTLTTWGSVVSGVPVGDDWLRVGERFLPMRVAGEIVLQRAPEATEPEEPEEPEATELAEDQELEATEPEVLEAPEAEATAEAEEQEATEPEAPEDSEPEATEPEEPEAEATEATEADREPDAEDEAAEATEAAEAETEEPEAEEEIYEEAALVAPEDLEDSEALDPFDGVTVQFGVLFRSFPVMDIRAGTFTASLAVTQRWPIAAAPSVDGEEPWSPNVVVMNHDIGGVEAISSSTTVNETDGVATQVDYVTVRVRQTFNLNLFPFDQQVLSVHVAPASPGSVNMRLVPMHIPGERDLEAVLLEDHGFHLGGVFERGNPDSEDVTVAAPPRGLMEVALDRRPGAYTSSVFMPAVLLLGMCWLAFFLPVPDPALAVPRVAVSATAFLAMLVFNMHVEQMVPARFGRMWIDVFTESVSILVFCALAFNTLEQYVHSHMCRPGLASKLGRELRIFYPTLCALVLGSCCLAPWGESLDAMSAVCRLFLAIGVFGYFWEAYRRAVSGEDEKSHIENYILATYHAAQACVATWDVQTPTLRSPR